MTARVPDAKPVCTGNLPNRKLGRPNLYAAAVGLLTLSRLTAAQSPATPQTTSCSARFEAAITPECFDTLGVNFTGVIYLLSGNRSGAIPSGYTYQTFLQLMCSTDKQDSIVTCVLGEMQKQNGSQCAADDRSTLLARGNQLLMFMDMICGQPCEQEATQSLAQCYAANNMNPEPILSPNYTIIEDKYSIIGKNETEFDNFCTNRQKLFSCLSPLSSTCPGILQRLYTIGLDLQAMEIATGFLCSDKQKFLKGLTCFNTPSQDTAQCDQATATSIRTVLMGRYQTGTIPPSKFQENLCKTKLTQIECQLAAYGKSCDAEVTALRVNVECTMLPKPCREDLQFQTQYGGICQKVTTPVPVQTVRPTQGKIDAVPIDGGPTSATSIRSVKNAAADISLSLVVVLLAAVTNGCCSRS